MSTKDSTFMVLSEHLSTTQTDYCSSSYLPCGVSGIIDIKGRVVYTVKPGQEIKLAGSANACA